MRLINDFFTARDMRVFKDRMECKVSFNPSHRIFEAHFPGHSITPGVCLVQMVSELLERHFENVFLLSTAINIRFKKPVYPTDSLLFVFSKMQHTEGQLKVNVSIENETGQYARMLLSYNVSK